MYRDETKGYLHLVPWGKQKSSETSILSHSCISEIGFSQGRLSLGYRRINLTSGSSDSDICFLTYFKDLVWYSYVIKVAVTHCN